jgi:hypothetical protein
MQKLKKNTEWSILPIKEYSLNSLIKYTSSLSEEWLYDTSRQDSYKTHKDTNMFQIKFMNYEWNPGDPINIVDVNSITDQEAKKEFDELINDLELEYDAKAVRIEFVRMLSNTSIRPHIDGGDMLYIIRRCHIPLITNDKVFFTVLGNTVNMKTGTAYEINNGMLHSVENNSDSDRVHLIVDLLPNSYF